MAWMIFGFCDEMDCPVPEVQDTCGILNKKTPVSLVEASIILTLIKSMVEMRKLLVF